MDPKLPSPPEWLVSFVLGTMAPWMFSAMLRLLKTFPSSDVTLPPLDEKQKKPPKAGLRYAHRISKNEALYGMVQRRSRERVDRIKRTS